MAATMSKSWVRGLSTFPFLRARPGYPPGIRYREDILPRVPRVLEDSEPEYPPIEASISDPGEEGEKARRDAFIDTVRRSETPNDMIYHLQKHQKWQHMVYPNAFHTGYSAFFRDIAKTNVVDGMPENVNSLSKSDQVNKEAEVLSDHIKDIITTDLHSAKRMKKIPSREQGERAQSLGQSLVRVLVSYLGLKYGHLTDAVIDERCSLKSFWESGERRIQFIGEPVSSVRTSEPLGLFVETSDDVCLQGVQDWPYDPRDFGIFKKHINSVCFPGFKHRTDNLYPHTQVYGLCVDKEMAKGQKVYNEIHESLGLISGYAWINALAMYQGYCWYMDIPRPMAAQVIFTDGNLFSFYCYQANTINQFHEPGPLNNVCFQEVMVPMFTDIKEGVIRDFNEEALRLLVALFMNPTVKSA